MAPQVWRSAGCRARGLPAAGREPSGNGDGPSAAYTDATRASAVWAAGTDGTGVTVALIDSGVNDTGDLAGTVIHAEDMTGTGSADLLGHGTFIAGLIAGSGASSNGAVKG